MDLPVYAFKAYGKVVDIEDISDDYISKQKIEMRKKKIEEIINEIQDIKERAGLSKTKTKAKKKRSNIPEMPNKKSHKKIKDKRVKRASTSGYNCSGYYIESIIVGKDKDREFISPRVGKNISVFLEGKRVRGYADFYVFAVRLSNKRRYLIAKYRAVPYRYRSARITFLWNAKSMHNYFIPRGYYNIYAVVYIKVKGNKKPMRVARYWGSKKKRYIAVVK